MQQTMQTTATLPKFFKEAGPNPTLFYQVKLPGVIQMVSTTPSWRGIETITEDGFIENKEFEFEDGQLVECTKEEFLAALDFAKKECYEDIH
jgi:hypothetical protein